MRRQIAMALSALVLGSGCVSVSTASNYRPVTETRNQDFYSCEQQNNQPTAGAQWNQYGGSVAMGQRVSPKMLLDCMQAKNYQLVKASTGLVWFELLTSPIWLSLDILCGGLLFQDMAAGTAEN